MTTLSPIPVLRIYDNSGDLAIGAKVYTYQAGTSTPQATYTDSSQTTPNANPVVANSRGEVVMWLGTGLLYKISVQDALGNLLYTSDNVSGADYASGALRSDLASTSDATKGAGLSGFNFSLNYAANTIGWAVKNALGANPLWFGAKGDGVNDDVIAVQAAFNFSKTAFIPSGFIFLCKSGLVMNQAQQRIIGDGLASEIRFQLTAPGVGIATSNQSGQQGIYGVLLNGVSNVTKVVSVGSPQLTISNAYIYNTTTTGHCVYQEDENVGTNTYVFGLALMNVIVRGPGPTNLNTYGLRTGSNSQTTRVIGGAITNCSTLIWVNGATTQMLIQGPILQNCADTEQAIHIDRPGSGMPCYEVSILSTYFEQAHRAIVVGDCDCSGLTIRGCIANRNTSSSKATSYFYLAAGGTAASTQNISIDENYVQDYGAVLGLGNEYGARLVSCRGNTAVSCTSYSSGTFADNAYEIRSVNFSSGPIVESGTPTVTVSSLRYEGKNGTMCVPLSVTTRDALARIDVRVVANLGNTVTLNVVESEITTNTQTVIGTVSSGGASGTYTPNVSDGYRPKPGFFYTLQAVFDNVGTSSYVYPASVRLYK